MLVSSDLPAVVLQAIPVPSAGIPQMILDAVDSDVDRRVSADWQPCYDDVILLQVKAEMNNDTT